MSEENKYTFENKEYRDTYRHRFRNRLYETKEYIGI